MPRPWTPSTPDRALLRDGGREPAAFAELYRRYEAIVAGYLQRRTRDPEVTADLTSETFATALLRADRFVGDGPAVGWLLGIARHHHLHWLRSGRAERRACQRLGVERIDLTDASIERVDRLLDDARPDSAIAVAVAGLTEGQREAVLAFVLDEQPYAELAAAFGVPEATVRQRVSRGLSRLRTSIEGARP